jgi:hypothetical protein
MKPDDLDRILSSEDAIEPSAAFTATVMRAFHEHAMEPPPLPFPWPRFAAGVAACAAMAGAGTALLLRAQPALTGAVAAVAPLAAIAPELGAAALAVAFAYATSRLPRLLAEL